MVYVDLPWLGRESRCFLGPRPGDGPHGPYDRHNQTAGGEGQNGIELWRELYADNEGGVKPVARAGLRRFHNVPVFRQAASRTLPG